MGEQANLEHAPAADRLAHRRAIVERLQSTAERTQSSARALLRQERLAGRVASFKPLWIVNAIAVQGTRQAFWALAADPGIRIILQDKVFHLPETGQTPPASLQTDEAQWHVKRIQADRAWEALGMTGEGVIVANLDSGVDWQHPDLKAAYRGYTGKPLPTHAGNWYCATDEGYAYPGDGQGHGTHTMGTMVGQNGIGVAPGARWIAAKIFNNQGLAYESWIHDGFQWVLAPNGDPALAPDVVNNSWGNRNGSDATFLADIQALRAAGILPVFAAGNGGPADRTIWTPASLQPSLAVGATDRDDLVALFASRGPSPWGEVKPEVSAPGVNILSSLPGGAHGLKDGTSMAAPQVAGAVALMLQANPALSPDQVEAILTGTAQPLGEASPNNEYGWGLLNAYAAVQQAGHFGQINGQVRDAHSGAPIAHATVHALSHDGQLAATAKAGSDGRYTVGLAAGHYDLTWAAFGYQSQTLYGVAVDTGKTTSQDAALLSLPTGLLHGTVAQAGTGAPLTATLSIPGAPLTTTTRAIDGSYSMVLPRGIHTVRAQAGAHRFVTATVVISAGQTTIQNYRLEPAPRILLVDSGAWYNGSQRATYERALQELRYPYDLHVIARVHDTSSQVPDVDRLRPYDLVIWSAPQDAPGYLGASDAISDYLDGGGRLFLSGQDIAFWDGGGSQSAPEVYFWDHLKARYVADTTPSRVLDGQGALFAGLAITIAGEGGANNQIYPDVIDTAAASKHIARMAWRYQTDSPSDADELSGGQVVGPCLPYRAIYLAFGLEGVNDSAARLQVLRRSIAWLAAPSQQAGIELKSAPQAHIARPGEQITHTVQVHNLSEQSADLLALSLEGHRWPAAIRDPMPVTLGACQTTTLHISVDIPPDAGWHARDSSTLRARSSLSTGLQAAIVLTSKTPAPVLLVDNARFFWAQSPYRDTLERAGIEYDFIPATGTQRPSPPTGKTLSMYPVVIWFTGYNWYDPLSEEAESALLDYLQSGGRVLFSSQDYLYYGRDRPLAHDYLGVLDYSEGLSATVATGEPFHPIGWGLGPYALAFPYSNWSDALVPVPDAEIAFRGQHGRPIALTYGPPPTERGTSAQEQWRTAFFAFPMETLPQDALSEVMQRTVGWLSWLGASTWDAKTAQAKPARTISSGSLLTMTGVVHNDGPAAVANARFATTLPAGTSLVPGSLSPEATFVPAARQIEWQGALARNEHRPIEFSIRVDDPLPEATWIHFPAQIGYNEHALSFEAPLFMRVNASDLSLSTLEVTPGAAPPTHTLAYTLIVRNTGVRDALAVVTASAPSRTQFTGALDIQGVGSGEILSKSLAWDGLVKAGSQTRLHYQLTSGDRQGYWLAHQVHVWDQYDEHWTLEAYAHIRLVKIYLPVVTRQTSG